MDELGVLGLERAGDRRARRAGRGRVDGQVMAVSLPSATTVASVASLELVEPGVADPEVVGDLVIDRVGHPLRPARSGVR